MIIVQIIGILALPFLLFKLQNKMIWMKAIVMAYIGGVVIGNISSDFFVEGLLKEITGISIILAIPLMLFPTKIKNWLKQPKSLLYAYGLAVVATTISVLIGWYLFREKLTDIALISGMIQGVYTGGTVNLNAIGLAFNAPNSLSVLLNGYDMMFSAVYLLAIFMFLPRLLSKILKPNEREHINESPIEEEFSALKTKEKIIFISKGIGLSVLVLGLAVAISFGVSGEMNELILVFGVSLIAIAFSFLPQIRNLKGSMLTADYLMMIFGFSLGAQANVSQILAEQSGLMSYFVVTYSIMLIIHLVLSKIFKIDIDTFLISSTAAVFGPPFIGPVAESIQNRSIIGPGIIVALMGNAIGTYLGIAMVELLMI